jgi:hypothetical protein
MEVIEVNGMMIGRIESANLGTRNRGLIPTYMMMMKRHLRPEQQESMLVKILLLRAAIIENGVVDEYDSEELLAESFSRTEWREGVVDCDTGLLHLSVMQMEIKTWRVKGGIHLLLPIASRRK